MNPYNQMYQPYTNPYANRMSPTFPTTNKINWVQGIEGAKAYPLQPGESVQLLDSEADKFYVKVADNIGMCTLRKFRYEEEFDEPTIKTPEIDLSQYVTKAELKELLQEVKNEQSVQPVKSASKSKPATE